MQLNGQKVKYHAYRMKNNFQLNRSGGGEGRDEGELSLRGPKSALTIILLGGFLIDGVPLTGLNPLAC